MSERWIGLDGYPCTFEESFIGKPLVAALTKLEGASQLSEADIRAKAYFLYRHSSHARELAGPANLPASQNTSEQELRKLHDLCEKLANHIDGMHAPAVTALSQEGYLAKQLAKDMRNWMEGARHAYSQVEGKPKRGAHSKVEAKETAELAGLIYHGITGKRPTCTTDPVNHGVYGNWPSFLADVFDALYIKASVAAQSRAVSEKMRSENGD